MEKFGWRFIDDNGTFVCENPQKLSRLYFPLANEAEFMSCITPNLKGDIKTGQNSFLLAPVTTEDLHNSRAGRNFWIYIDKDKIWSLAKNDNDKVTLEAGLLWHKISRINKKYGLKAEILNFVPASGEHVEIMQVEITNISKKTLSFTPTCAIPIYGRSADNLRDHRHVTSLLNRVFLHKYGVINKPTMSFDERGHRLNHFSYYVLGFVNNGQPPLGFFPTQESFIGEGGDLEQPAAIIHNLAPKTKITAIDQGKECLGGLQFKRQRLKPGQSITFNLILGIAEEPKEINKVFKKFSDLKKINNSLSQTKKYWRDLVNKIAFSTGDKNFDNWLKWVSIQPVLRKIYGCSFLPDFDYGRGGKGWRDLWQDSLALILSEPSALKETLIANFSGVRIDGSNATIITKKPGYFIADRNKIARVWMDHGAWPYFTLELYIHQTGDFDILLEKTSYFRDAHLRRTQAFDHHWKEECKHLTTKSSKVYYGTILEHILVQHLVQFHNVGPHNNIRLEGADWNDGLDMARHRGESVAFSAFYGRNLKNIALLLEETAKAKKISSIKVFKELLLLLAPLNYESPTEKQRHLNKYFAATEKCISGKTVNLDIKKLIAHLNQKADWIFRHIQKQEWIKNPGFFNGYYDDHSRRLEGKFKNKVRMTLTGQVFPIMSGLASEEQIKKVFLSAKKFLQDKKFGGFRLNTDFGEVKSDLGRAFGFAYGEKENGSFFSHMNTMFAYALYERGFAKEGFEVLNSLYRMALDLKNSKIYPGLPEYFNSTGRGMYAYLTGSASWYILTLFTQGFGIKARFGDLILHPRFSRDAFLANRESVPGPIRKVSESKFKVSFNFAGKRFTVSYIKPQKLDYPDYQIKKVSISSPNIKFYLSPHKIIIPRSFILRSPKNLINIQIILK
ncbi:MAG: cellobiose phosphorylase [Candidatus Omnitrophica bacterium]|nr:cellobiose phosphorylase [Candidatus Omnitrophota bacterium]